VTLVQESGGKAFVLSTVNGSLKMQKRPKDSGGTDAAVHATFRLVPHEGAGAGAAAMLEPLDMPGMVVTDMLTVSAEKSSGAPFNVVPGLDGAPGSVSLELRARPGCYLVATDGGKWRQEGPGRLWRRPEARRRRRRRVPAGSELRAGRAAAAVPPDELRRQGGEEELPPRALVHLE
jgi:uncharacterized protein